MRKIKRFLKLPNINFDVDERIKRESKKENKQLSRKLKESIFDYYQETYKLCDKRFNSSSCCFNL